MLTLISGAITSAVIAFTSSGVVVWAMFAIATFTGVIWNVITVSLRQTVIPDRLLGRVNSVYRFFGWGMMPIGILFGGVIVEVVARATDRETGLRAPFLLSGMVEAALAVYAISRFSTARIEAVRATPGGDTGAS